MLPAVDKKCQCSYKRLYEIIDLFILIIHFIHII